MTTGNPFIRAEEAARKGFDFSPWGGLDGFLKASQAGNSGNAAALKRMVPDLAHAVDMTAVAVSSLPFEVVDEGGEVVDASTDWKNVLGGMDNPQRLIYLIASSLCGGAAYVIPTATKVMIADLQYVSPHTILPQFDHSGLTHFNRASDLGETDIYQPDELIHFWLPDSDVEIGPAKNHPLSNATLDAMLIWAMKNTLKQYGDRGFVPITLLGAKGMPPTEEKTKTEAFFTRLLRGGFNEPAKVVNSDALSLVRVGAGMDELKQSYLEIRRDAKESIADSFGIPTALFMSDNAFASEFDALRIQWYTASRFVGMYQTIQEVLTDQLLKNYNKKFRFTPESLDVFQADESARAASLGSFVSAVSTNPDIAQLGMGILGYDLTKEQQAMFDKIIKDKAEEKAKLDAAMAEGKVDANGKPIPQAAGKESNPVDKPADKKPAPPTKSLPTLSPDELKDISLWYNKAKWWFLQGRGTAVDWENKHLREEIAAPIRLKLAEAKTEYDIMKAFEMEATETPAPVYTEPTKTSDVLTLAAAIKEAIAEAKE